MSVLAGSLPIPPSMIDRVDVNLNSPSLQNQPKPQNPGDFRCGICNKTYSRRDLRDRHRRRCIKTAGQERVSKRKSCETCAQKKLRCSMTRPACSRCVHMRTQCNYPPASVPANPAAAAVAAARRNSNNNDANAYSNSASASSSASPGGGSSYNPIAELNRSLESSLAAMAEDMLSNVTDQQQRQSSLSLNRTSTPAFDPPSAPWSPILTPTNMDFMLLADSSLIPAYDMEASSLPWDDGFPSDLSSGDIFPGGLGDQPGDLPLFLSLHDITKGPLDPLEAFAELYPTIHAPIPAAFFSPDSLPSTDGTSAPSLIFGHDFLPRSGALRPNEDNHLFQEMLEVIRGFPALILERDFWSPFVHHQLYRCSLGTAEPLDIALTCVSQAGSAGSSHGLDSTINQEREKLVRNFHIYTDTPETCLAALHAVCIYQILGLFGDPFREALAKPKETTRQREESEKAAELHISFLLKMARHLYKLHKASLLVSHEDDNWRRWKFTESLRRNIFLVHVINILGSRARKLNEVYFEPLGDDMLLHLPLPAPDDMWRACSEEEWLLARERALQPEPTPLSLTLYRLLEMDQTGLDLSTLPPITRMVLSCWKIAPAQNA